MSGITVKQGVEGKVPGLTSDLANSSMPIIVKRHRWSASNRITLRTERQRQRDRETERQRDRGTETERQRDRGTGTETEPETETETERQRDRGIETEGQRDKDRGTEGQRQRDRGTDRQRDRIAKRRRLKWIQQKPSVSYEAEWLWLRVADWLQEHIETGWVLSVHMWNQTKRSESTK